MYELESDLPKKEYLRELKGCFGSPFMVFDERITGVVIGSFFSVAHYTEYEYDRRFNVICNRAWGRVKTNPVDGKTEVTFIRGSGLFSPFWLLFFALLLPMGVYFTSFSYDAVSLTADDTMLLVVFGIIGSLIICGTSTLNAIFSDRGAYGAGEITKMLENPKDYYC